MARRSYITVAAPLDETADAVADYLDGRGYTVRVEPQDVSYPYTPTLRAKRKSTKLFVEVVSVADPDRLLSWARYGKSATSETCVTLAMPVGAERRAADDDAMRELGLGLLVVEGADVREIFPAPDLSMNFELPDLGGLPKAVRALIAPSYERFDRGEWRDGFEDACQVVESEARRYLKEGVVSGRIIALTAKGNPQALTAARIDKMTMGQLKDTFGAIQNKNGADSTIYAVLDRINKDRIGAVHERRKRQTIERLRRNVGHHMWAIDSALRALFDVK